MIKLLKNLPKNMLILTFEGLSGYGELDAPGADVVVELALEFLVQAPGLAVVLSLQLYAPGDLGVPADGYEVVNSENSVVLNSSIQNLEGSLLEAVEGVLLLAASLEYLAVALGRLGRGGQYGAQG